MGCFPLPRQTKARSIFTASWATMMWEAFSTATIRMSCRLPKSCKKREPNAAKTAFGSVAFGKIT